MLLRHPNFRSRGFSSDNNQDQDNLGVGNHANYCDDETISAESITNYALKKLKISNEIDISKKCPLQKLRMRIKNFMRTRNHPCKLKAMILNTFNS